jgi:hypothetical protein
LLRCRDAHLVVVVVIVVVVVAVLAFVDVLVLREMVETPHETKGHLYVVLSSNSIQVASVFSSLTVSVRFEVVVMMFR